MQLENSNEFLAGKADPYNSTDAPTTQILPVGPVSASGEQSVQPKENTTYNLTAVGPGGTATQKERLCIGYGWC